MSSVIFIRHGESLGNVNPGYYKQPDVANILSERGVQQCLDLSQSIHSYLDEDLNGLHTLAIASRYQRAQITAQIVMSRSGLISPVAIDHRINEVIHNAESLLVEDPAMVIARVRSLVESYHFNLILFTHGVLMATVDPDRGSAKNGEVRKYDRAELLDKFLK